MHTHHNTKVTSKRFFFCIVSLVYKRCFYKRERNKIKKKEKKKKKIKIGISLLKRTVLLFNKFN